MAAGNYESVVDQLRAAGLIVERLEVGRLVRCKVEDDRERRGWYAVHEVPMHDGGLLLVGSYGVWRGDDRGARKIEIGKATLDQDQRDAVRRRLAEDKKRADAQRARDAERAAARAAKAWAACSPTGDAEYLARKGIGAHGVRFSPSGALVIPMLDTGGRIHGLQVIHTAAGAHKRHRPLKDFWPVGLVKKAHFHLLGMPAAGGVLLIAEGYATAASLHEATGLPVAVAFDAGNLGPVAAALHKRYKATRILICADDDAFADCLPCKARVDLSAHPVDCPACGAPHQRSNTGVTRAGAAALEVNGAWAAPRFADADGRSAAFIARGTKLTDYNDLHAVEGLHVVRAQIESRLSELGWNARSGASASTRNSGGEGGDTLRPIDSVGEMLDRFALVYGQGGIAFDHREHCLLSLSDIRDACVTRDLHRAWAEHPDKAIVRMREVGFDPAGTDPEIRCNLWAGWPTTPRAGSCQWLLDLLGYMCGGDANPRALQDWVLKWLAYPIQHPGAKMRTTLVLHGPQGTGKNLFFESVMAIYGQYGRVIDQAAIEDKFNDWASRKLFLIADEVVARSDLYHVKNKLKAFITGDWIRINPKNMAAYDERNHCNVVFLSNESMPVVLEEDDRRHTVIWTPGELPQDFYASVRRELAEGGVAALHHHLLHLDLGDFTEGTRPPPTGAKAELIRISLDSPSRFYYDLTGGDVGGIAARPALCEDVYDLYKSWCARVGVRHAPMPKFINALARKHKVCSVRKRYINGTGVRGPHAVLLLGQTEPPPDTSEAGWLGDHIDTFRSAVKDYKGGAWT